MSLRVSLLSFVAASLVAGTAYAQSEAEAPPLPPPAPAPVAAPAPAAPPAAPAPVRVAAPAPSSWERQEAADPPPAEAVEDRPKRHGFTLELGLGAAFTHVSLSSSDATKSEFGLAPLSLSVGGFLNPKVALLLRAAGTSYFESGYGGETKQKVSAFYGAHVQYWIDDTLMISGGPGLMLFAENSFLAATSVKPLTGYGASFRLGYSVLATKHHSLRFSLEAFPAKYDEAFVFGSALNFEWQYF